MQQKIICNKEMHSRLVAAGMQHRQKTVHGENMQMIVEMYYRNDGGAVIHVWANDGLALALATEKSDSGEFGHYAEFNFMYAQNAAQIYSERLTTTRAVIRYTRDNF